jgi:DNA-binding transcriptional MerR regulator
MRTWTIRELADEFGVSLRTIRFYEEHGIVEPTRHGQRRVFHERDRTRLALALRGRRIGLSVAQSKAIIELYDIADHTTQLQSLLPVVRRQRADAEARKADLERLLDDLREVEELCVGALAGTGDHR